MYASFSKWITQERRPLRQTSALHATVTAARHRLSTTSSTLVSLWSRAMALPDSQGSLGWIHIHLRPQPCNGTVQISLLEYQQYTNGKRLISKLRLAFFQFYCRPILTDVNASPTVNQKSDCLTLIEGTFTAELYLPS